MLPCRLGLADHVRRHFRQHSRRRELDEPFGPPRLVLERWVARGNQAERVQRALARFGRVIEVLGLGQLVVIVVAFG